MNPMGVRDYKVCHECKYLDQEKTKIGRLCKCPARPFREGESKYARYKATNHKACKHFEA